jgi:hypothetical protein
MHKHVQTFKYNTKIIHSQGVSGEIYCFLGLCVDEIQVRSTTPNAWKLENVRFGKRRQLETGKRRRAQLQHKQFQAQRGEGFVNMHIHALHVMNTNICARTETYRLAYNFAPCNNVENVPREHAFRCLHLKLRLAILLSHIACPRARRRASPEQPKT